MGAGALDVEVQHLAADSTGNLLAGWVLAGENPILRYGSAGADSVEYYLEDASDSIRALINTSKQVVAEFDYDAFGVLLSPGTGPTSAAGGDFGYHAAWHDEATGLYHMRARTYDVETGRFLTPDPANGVPQVPESYNLYAFANNNPHLYSDPTGLFSITEINVSGAIQRSLSTFQGRVIRQAQKFAADKIEEIGKDLLLDALQGFLPLNIQGRNFDGRLGREIGGWLDFQSTVTSQIKSLLPFADWLWIEVPIYNSTGVPEDDGVNVGRTATENIAAIIESALGGGISGISRPDYLIRSGAPTNRGDDPTWLIGDLSISAQNLITKYIDPGDQKGQWQAITRHAREFGIRTSLFIVWNPATATSLAKLTEAGLMNGDIVFVVSLRG